MATPIHYKDAEGLQTRVAGDFGAWSESVTVTQEMINQFADLSGDHMWLHVDVERCKKESPFRSTIAHGFLLLSMLSRFKSLPDVSTIVCGYSHMMNYGSDKLRFLGAVPVNSEIHVRCRIKEVSVEAKKTKVVAETQLSIVGKDSPSLLYELMFVYL